MSLLIFDNSNNIVVSIDCLTFDDSTIDDYCCSMFDLEHGFSTWGVREKLTGGTKNFKNPSEQVYLGRVFDLGVC
jgi:hypothetical protein